MIVIHISNKYIAVGSDGVAFAGPLPLPYLTENISNIQWNAETGAGVINYTDAAPARPLRGQADYTSFIAPAIAAHTAQKELIAASGTSLEGAHAQKWQEIIQGQADIMARVKAAYPDDEREGWPYKLAEAAEILIGSAAPMPYIDAEFAGAAGLYVNRVELAQKIVEKNALFKAVSGFVNGQQTAMYHALNALAAQEGVTAAEILAMPVKYTMPEGVQA